MSVKITAKLFASAAVLALSAPVLGQATSGQGGQSSDTATRPDAVSVAQPDTALDAQDIVVTGSRIRSSNFEAPTPVLAVGSELIDQRGTTNIANVLNEIPAFTGTLTPASTNLNSRQNGVNVVDLRGLGTNRNLVLLNGRRGTPFDEFENIDLNAVPTLAVERVEVVTGGASAAYGSDAVSGVVNLIFDDKLDGAKVNVQYGLADEGDAQDFRVSAAFGTKFGGDRGHFLVAADYDDNKGIPAGRARAFQRRSAGLVANPANVDDSDGKPEFLIRENSVLFLASPNGITLPGGGPTSNLEFFPGGVVQPRVLGDNIGGSLMTGGSGSRLADSVALYVPAERINVLAVAHYDVTEGVTVFGEASYARSKSRGALIKPFTLGDVTIQPDNAYLPASVAALNTPFSLFRTFEEIPPITSISVSKNMRFVGGLKGEFGNNWSWEVSGQYGQTNFSNDQTNNLLPGKLVLAADAVFDPSQNRVVCRANLAGANGAPGCEPLNLFGAGSPSQAALNYIVGTGTSDTRIRQTVFAGNIGGELFQGWAGPILATVGVEHRRETLDRHVNAENANGDFLIVNAQPLTGKFNVTEGFGEIAVPILDGAQKLDFNAAARYTHYSTVGNVVTWKTGLTFNPIQAIRLRGTISRDIRAPSIGETFVTSVLLFDNISNPFVPGSGTQLVRTPTSGNINLREERALTKTAGAVISIGRFKTSLDWFDINLKGAIGTLNSQSIVDRCFAGNDAICSAITFNPDKSIFEIRNQNLNLGTFKVQGLDFESRYSLPLGDGTLGLGVVASYLIHKKIAPSGTAPIDVAGEVGGGSGFGLPDFKATASVNYESDSFGAFAQLRYIGSGVYDATYGPEQLAASENHIGAVAYVDMSVKYKFGRTRGGDTELYAGVDNLLDRQPPVAPLDFIANSSTNAAIYDVIGRKYYVGVRAKF